MDLEFMILDTFDTLRPGLIKFQSLEEAEDICKKLELRESKGQDITDILSRYQKDGGGYDQVYYDEDLYAAYYDEEDAGYYQQEDPYYDEEEEQQEQTEAVDLAKEERQKIISEYERLEMQAFESEFNSLILESTQSIRNSKIQSVQINPKKKEIVLPF